jgi:hypothetical protein
VGVLAATGFVGISSASAANICSTAGTGTGCAGRHGKELTTQTLSASSTGTRTARITANFLTLECDSSFSGEVIHEGIGKLTSVTFINCVSSLGACTSAAANASNATPWLFSSASTGGESGNITIKEAPMTIEFTCVGITCKYTATEAGGGNGKLTATDSDTAPTSQKRASQY